MLIRESEVTQPASSTLILFRIRVELSRGSTLFYYSMARYVLQKSTYTKGRYDLLRDGIVVDFAFSKKAALARARRNHGNEIIDVLF